VACGSRSTARSEPLRLPKILPRDDQLHAILRSAHTVLACAFFITVLMHVAAALFHALIRRDGVFGAMATARIRAQGKLTWALGKSEFIVDAIGGANVGPFFVFGKLSIDDNKIAPIPVQSVLSIAAKHVTFKVRLSIPQVPLCGANRLSGSKAS
jgi:Prokaryotic cytochrome b561